MRLHGPLTLILLSLTTIGCMHRPAQVPTVAPALAGDPLHPGHTSGWIDARLYFGLGPADHPSKGVTEAEWREFLDKQVTPRFPDGLSVADIYGQWQGKNERSPERLRSKMLIIDTPTRRRIARRLLPSALRGSSLRETSRCRQ